MFPLLPLHGFPNPLDSQLEALYAPLGLPQVLLESPLHLLLQAHLPLSKQMPEVNPVRFAEVNRPARLQRIEAVANRTPLRRSPLPQQAVAAEQVAARKKHRVVRVGQADRTLHLSGGFADYNNAMTS